MYYIVILWESRDRVCVYVVVIGEKLLVTLAMAQIQHSPRCVGHTRARGTCGLCHGPGRVESTASCCRKITMLPIGLTPRTIYVYFVQVRRKLVFV